MVGWRYAVPSETILDFVSENDFGILKYFLINWDFCLEIFFVVATLDR